MKTKHSFIPPQQLVDKWVAMFEHCDDINVLTEVAQWGADQELDACCEWLSRSGHQFAETYVAYLRAARRPKPVNLKKAAYDALDTYIYGNPDPKDKERTYNAIRRALESLPE